MLGALTRQLYGWAPMQVSDCHSVQSARRDRPYVHTLQPLELHKALAEVAVNPNQAVSSL